MWYIFLKWSVLIGMFYALYTNMKSLWFLWTNNKLVDTYVDFKVGCQAGIRIIIWFYLIWWFNWYIEYTYPEYCKIIHIINSTQFNWNNI